MGSAAASLAAHTPQRSGAQAPTALRASSGRVSNLSWQTLLLGLLGGFVFVLTVFMYRRIDSKYIVAGGSFASVKRRQASLGH